MWRRGAPSTKVWDLRQTIGSVLVIGCPQNTNRAATCTLNYSTLCPSYLFPQFPSHHPKMRRLVYTVNPFPSSLSVAFATAPNEIKLQVTVALMAARAPALIRSTAATPPPPIMIATTSTPRPSSHTLQAPTTTGRRDVTMATGQCQTESAIPGITTWPVATTVVSTIHRCSCFYRLAEVIEHGRHYPVYRRWLGRKSSSAWSLQGFCMHRAPSHQHSSKTSTRLPIKRECTLSARHLS